MSCHCHCPICSAPARPISVPAISRSLDRLIIELDGRPSPLRTRWLRVLKAGIERVAVPQIEVRQ